MSQHTAIATLAMLALLAHLAAAQNNTNATGSPEYRTEYRTEESTSTEAPVTCDRDALLGRLADESKVVVGASCGNKTGDVCQVGCVEGHVALDGDSEGPWSISCTQQGDYTTSSSSQRLTCKEYNKCDESPCDESRSSCEKTGMFTHVCHCKAGFFGAEEHVAEDGSGCAKLGIATDDGNFVLSAPLGKDIVFSFGNEGAGQRASVNEITAHLEELKDGLDGEINRATAADSSLAKAVGAEEVRARGAERQCKDNLGQEVERAKGMEDTLKGLVGSEQTRAKSEELDLSNRLKSLQGTQQTQASTIAGIQRSAETQAASTASSDAALSLKIDDAMVAATRGIAAEAATRTRLIAGVKNIATSARSTANAAKSTANAAKSKGDSLMKSVKGICIGLGFKWQNNECLPAPGSTDNNPAASCREVKDSGQKTGPYFVKHSGSGVARKVYCDNSYDGGGWELIHKIDGSSNHFRYDSGYWTSSSNTYRPNVFNGNYGENVKTYGFNYGRYREVRLRWRDPHDGGTWTWSNPSGWSSGRSPQNYFNSGRHICCSRYYQVHGSMEWRASGNRFSDQGCAGSVRVAQCTSGQGCTRWGFHWNNECGYGSNDAGGGWGIRPIHGAQSAGDWITCCQRHHGRRRDFDANMWARK